MRTVNNAKLVEVFGGNKVAEMLLSILNYGNTVCICGDNSGRCYDDCPIADARDIIKAVHNQPKTVGSISQQIKKMYPTAIIGRRCFEGLSVVQEIWHDGKYDNLELNQVCPDCTATSLPHFHSHMACERVYQGLELVYSSNGVDLYNAGSSNGYYLCIDNNAYLISSSLEYCEELAQSLSPEFQEILFDIFDKIHQKKELEVEAANERGKQAVEKEQARILKIEQARVKELEEIEERERQERMADRVTRAYCRENSDRF